MTIRNDMARKRTASFIRSTGGVAAVEFALIVPFILLLYLGTVDLSQALSADRKLSQLTGSLGDLVARTTVDDASLGAIIDYMAIGNAIMRPHDADATGMRITIADPVNNGEARVISSTAANGMIARSYGDVVSVPNEHLQLAADRCLVIAEGRYPFAPFFQVVFQSDITLAHRKYDIPRIESSICGEAELICAGYSPSSAPGHNCNDRHNSWGTGNGKGGGITNNNG